MKDEKELKPASMRVRDAADALLTIILEQVFPLLSLFMNFNILIKSLVSTVLSNLHSLRYLAKFLN